MADSYTLRNRLRKQTTGANVDSWGSILNDMLDLLDVALDDVLPITLDAPKTLTTANGAVDESRSRVLLITGAAGSANPLTVPAVEKVYTIINDCTGPVTVTTGSGLVTYVPQGTQAFVVVTAAGCRRINPGAKWQLIQSFSLSPAVTAGFGNATVQFSRWNEILISIVGASHGNGASQNFRIGLSRTDTAAVSYQTVGSYGASASLHGSFILSGFNPAGDGSGSQTGATLVGALADLATNGTLGASTPVIFPWRSDIVTEARIDFGGTVAFDAGTAAIYGR